MFACAPECLRAIDGEGLGNVDELTAAVIPLSRITFGVLVREDRAGCVENSLADEVLRGDQLEAGVLAIDFTGNRCGDLRIGVGQRAPAGRGFSGHVGFGFGSGFEVQGFDY